LGSRGKWVSKIQEYDLEIYHKKIIKGQVLAEIITKVNAKSFQMGEGEKFFSTTIKLERLNGTLI